MNLTDISTASWHSAGARTEFSIKMWTHIGGDLDQKHFTETFTVIHPVSKDLHSAQPRRETSRQLQPVSRAFVLIPFSLCYIFTHSCTFHQKHVLVLPSLLRRNFCPQFCWALLC